MRLAKRFDIQLFADGTTATAVNGADAGAENSATNAGEQAQATAAEKEEQKAKYTDADVDRMFNQKFAEWQKKQEKKTSEAERLGRMTAEEKANERIKALEDKLNGYERDAARAEMAKQARAILQDKGIHADDALLSNLIAEDADATKASVESFVSLFQAAVEKAVKERVKSDPPKVGGTVGMTKEQIMGVANRAERQRLIKENMELFK